MSRIWRNSTMNNVATKAATILLLKEQRKETDIRICRQELYRKDTMAGFVAWQKEIKKINCFKLSFCLLISC